MNKRKVLLLFTAVTVLFSILSISAVSYKPTETAEVAEVAEEPDYFDIRDYWAAHPEEYAHFMAVSDMASTAGRICPEGASDRCLSAVMYVIYNRYRSVGFPDTISGVCEQPKQWVMRSEAYITPKLRQLAEKNLNLWESGSVCKLPCNRDILYFNATEDGFELMSVFGGEVEQFVPYFTENENWAN